MVRHPFERVVSAYQDKVMGGTWKENHWAGKMLKRKYKEISFVAFVQMIVDTARKLCSSPGRRPCRLNIHWRPFVSRCGFCTTPYKTSGTSVSWPTSPLRRGLIGTLAMRAKKKQR